MGVVIFIDYSSDEIEDDRVPLASMPEIRELWNPIVKKLVLIHLAACFSSGLQLDEKYYDRILNEMKLLCTELEIIINSEEYGFTSPLSRCRRVIKIIKENPPGSENQLYIG